MKDLVDYAQNVTNKMLNSGHSENDISVVLKRIDKIRNDIDICMKRNRGWKYIRSNFLPELTRENTYYTQVDNKNIVCVDNGDGTYNVCFSFINPKEKFVDKDYKKYVLYNYYKGKYIYKNVKATSYMTAITIANNQNYMDFPVDDIYKYKMTLDINIYNDVTQQDCCVEKNTTSENYFKNCRLNYKRILKMMKDKYNLLEGSYRFYTLGSVSVLVIKKADKDFDVAFSFLSPKDYWNYSSLCDGDKKISNRYSVIENYMAQKNLCHVKNARNSLEAIVYAFNDNVNKFPRQYKKMKLSLCLSYPL